MTLQFSGVKYEIFKQANDIDYCFAVRIGGQEWMIHKVYNDFVQLHALLTQRYGAAALPKLTGVIYIRPVSDASGQKRLPKLEDYVNEILATWKQRFKNPRYFELPSPLGQNHPPLRVEETIGAFLEVEDHYEVGEDEEEGEEGAEGADAKNDGDDDAANAAEAGGAKAADSGSGGAGAAAEKPPKAGLAWSDDDNDDAKKPGKKPDAAAPASARKPATPAGAAPAAAAPAAASGKPAAKQVAFAPDALNAPGQRPAAFKPQRQLGDDFEVVDEHQDTFDSAHVLSQCRTMSGEVDVIVKDYVIHPKDHIAYNFQITFCGTSWIVTKRFSQLEKFHNAVMQELRGTEFAEHMPDIKDVEFPAWRKTDKAVAEVRYVFFTNYFKIIAPMMDEWFGPTFLTHFRIRRKDNEDLDSLERYASAARFVKVAVNRFLFDFFEFEARIDDFNADSAERVAKENERHLPQFMQKSLEMVRQEEKRVQKEKNLAYRRSIMERLSDAEFADLLRIIGSFHDDRHALGLIEYFFKNGYYYPGKSRLERMQELDAQAALRELRQQQASAAMAAAAAARKQPPPAIASASAASVSPLVASPTSSNFMMHAAQPSQRAFAPADASASSAAFSASSAAAAAAAAASAYDDGRAAGEEEDIFDQMGGSNLFGTLANGGDFTQMLCNAVETAKSQLRGRASTLVPAGKADMRGGMQPPQPGAQNSRYDVRKLSRPCGVTSEQLAQIAAAIPFNDTRALAIAIMSPILLEDTHLEQVFATLIYDWDKAAQTMEELLTKKEAPESFVIPGESDDLAPSQSSVVY